MLRDTELHSLNGCKHFHTQAGCLGPLCSRRENTIHGDVRTIRVMMEQGQAFHAGRQRNIDRVLHSAVAPTALVRVLSGQILRVMDDKVRIA